MTPTQSARPDHRVDSASHRVTRHPTAPRLMAGAQVSRFGAHKTLGGASEDCSGGKRGARPTDFGDGYRLTERRVEACVTAGETAPHSNSTGGRRGNTSAVCQRFARSRSGPQCSESNRRIDFNNEFAPKPHPKYLGPVFFPDT